MPLSATSQYPGYFYAFTLEDDAGSLITKNAGNYAFAPVKPKTDVVLSTSMCDDSTTLRFYVGGYHGLDETHAVEITQRNTGNKMTIEFPSSLSGGKEKFYRNLFARKLVFRKGTYVIRVPASGSEWDNLRETHFCPDYGGVDSYWDISALQKRQP